MLRINLDAAVEIEPSGTAQVVRPDIKSLYPSDAQVEEYAASLRRIFNRPPSIAGLDRYRNTPLPWLAGPFAVDGADRIWLATTVEDRGGTVLDIYDHAKLRGHVRVQGRVRALRVVVDSLYAYVSPVASDSATTPPRIDVYSIRAPDARARAPQP